MLVFIWHVWPPHKILTNQEVYESGGKTSSEKACFAIPISYRYDSHLQAPTMCAESVSAELCATHVPAEEFPAA